MVSMAQVRQFVDELVRQFTPDRVILFGSYARGEAAEDSDVDLLVIMPTRKRPLQQALEIRQRISRHFPLDLLVKTPAEVTRRLALHDVFLTSVIREGETLYESPGR